MIREKEKARDAIKESEEVRICNIIALRYCWQTKIE